VPLRQMPRPMARRFWIEQYKPRNSPQRKPQRDTAFVRPHAVAAGGNIYLFAANTAAATAAPTACNCDFVS